MILFFIRVSAQNNTKYWQQHVDYKMEVDVDAKRYRYTGSQELIYTNNSPDTLYRIFYHLYFNAFQPNSEMDIRSQTIKDPDPRVKNRISELLPSEIGYLKITSLSQDQISLPFTTEGTLLEVPLQRPILPNQKTTFNLRFTGQIPKQIRRSGRNNSEGVALSMTQWYPKLAEYDFEGWHTDPYIAREFHGVWGNFDVKIHIDKKYILGGTGYLQNPQEIGYNYHKTEVKTKKRKKKLTWHFKAPKVHDFAWAADPDFLHDKVQVPDGPILHFLYKNKPMTIRNWKKLRSKSVQLMQYFSNEIGKYPYDQYSIIQGGDGGMEYAMCTLITGNRNFGSLVGVTAHEMAHAWFQHILATNEAKHPWMDEGFTTYISTLAMHELQGDSLKNPTESLYKGYYQLANSTIEQPQSTHADRYQMNMLYNVAAYTKGAVFLNQLGYIIGTNALKKTIQRYYKDWKFRHPTPNDFKRVAEKISGIQLDWYLTDWTQTTNTIDYAIKEVSEKDRKTKVVLQRFGLMPMPIDLYITYKDRKEEIHYIPLQMMKGEKPQSDAAAKRVLHKDWTWASPTYSLTISKPLAAIQSITIDRSNRLADCNRSNNTYSNNK